MPTPTLRAFLMGPGAWQLRSPWHPLMAVLATVAIVVAGQLAPIVALALVTGEATGPLIAPGQDPLNYLADGAAATLLLLGQATLALLTFAAASLFGGRLGEVLSLDRPGRDAKFYLYAVIVMVPLLAAINTFAYWLHPSGFVSDFKQFAALVRAPQPVTAFLAIAIAAPLWEEMLFRGFLLGPLAGAFGYWPSAVFVSGAWTILHIGYSAAGLVEVFLIGLYFSWLLWRTGSLWVPIACHAAYNASLFVAVRYLPI